MSDLKTFLTTISKTSAEPTPTAQAPAKPPAPDIMSQSLSPSGPTLMSPEELSDLRRRILEGYDPPAEEMCKAIQSILADRTGRIEVGAEKKPRKRRTSKPDVTGLLDDLLPGPDGPDA